LIEICLEKEKEGFSKNYCTFLLLDKRLVFLLIRFYIESYFALREIHEYLEGDRDDFDVRHGSVAALDEVGQDLDGSAVVGGHLDTTVGGVVS